MGVAHTFVIVAAVVLWRLRRRIAWTHRSSSRSASAPHEPYGTHVRRQGRPGRST